MSELIFLNEKSSVGVAVFDNEHQMIIGIINTMYNEREKVEPKAFLKKILDELIEYAMNHFAHEEKLMAKHQYPDWMAHNLEHRHFVQKITEFKTMAEVAPDKTVEEVFQYLKVWWLNHILVVDAKYRPFFNSKGLR